MREFQHISSLAKIEQFISQNQLSFLFISQTNCSVCKGLLPQMKQLMSKYPKIQLGYIDASEVEAVAGRFSVFTAPVLLLFVDGKEYIREARIVHLQRLEEKIDKIYENLVG
ncbi:thioredoxin family protein [Virgibacillus alimentarius]|uniref:Thiol-disulfide isomerase/thioredoxin n=1 Tax=Virgibacillus alimentarius TaxID=698769 RepID=A0ABS4S6S9_9BACI|nr:MULTISPECIES: thioredoxin family protein [Virgibacillus]MBP2257211.1 thiol-disulfide isomerase/thioredoxin [Virgibacillus alimentarius]HLR67405.1 thioredoxin family protein [Virgibacillus sp.]